MEARRLAADAELDLDVLGQKATEPSFAKQLFLRVVSETAPSLTVTFVPKSIVALASTQMKFTVKDQFGAGVSAAHITVGNENADLIAGNALEATETEVPGEYVVDGVQPQGIGTIDYLVEAEGFKKAKGTFAVLPPAKILEVTPAKLQASVDSESIAAISFTVANKVSNAVTVRVTALARGSPPQFTDMYPSPATFTIGGEETRDAELVAGLNNLVLRVSNKPQTLNENVEGVLRVTARIGRVSQNIDVPLSVKTSFKQQSLDDVWDASATELSFDLNTETGNSQVQTLTVSNNGPYPLLINQENTMKGAFAMPLSAIIASGESADFAVISSIAQDVSRSCFIEDGTNEGVLSLYASFQGITSKKTVGLSSKITSTATCAPDGGFSLGLPADVRLTLPSGAKQKQNADGSTTVKLPADDSLMLFAAGASLTAAEAQVPMNIPMVVPPQWVSSLGNGAWRLVLPVQAQIAIPADTTPQSQPDSTVLLILGGAQLVLPAGTPISLNPSGERVAMVAPGMPIIFQTLPFTSLLEMLAPNSVEVSLPIETTLIMPPGTIEVKQPDSVSPIAVPQGSNAFYGTNQQLSSFGYNPKVVKLPDGNVLAFTQEATSKTDASGLLQVTIPADAQFLVPGGFVAFSQAPTTVLDAATTLDFADKEGAFVLLLPMPAVFSYGADEATLTRDSVNRKYTIMVGRNAAMQFIVEPTPTTQTGSSRKALGIPAMSPITVLYGGAAAELENPTDVSACPETFKSEQATLMDFPTGTHASTDGANLVLTPAECNDAAKITVVTKDGQELYTSPAAFKVIVAGGKISKGAPEDESAKTVNVPAKALITFKICSKGDDELKKATLSVPGQADITLPATATWKGDTDVSLGGVKKVSISVGTRQLDISKTDKLSFETSLPGTPLLKDPKRTDKVVLPPWSKISYVPYCDKASTGKLSVKVERNVLDASDTSTEHQPLAYDWAEVSANGKQPIDIEIYDDKATVKVNGKAEDYAISSEMQARDVAALAQICVENKGVTTISFLQPTLEGTKGNGDLLREALPNDVDHMHFLQQEEAGKQLLSIAPKPGFPCHTFQLEMVIPDAAKDADLCIKEDYKSEGYLVLKGTGEKGVALERKIPIRLTLKAGNCGNKNKDKAIKDFDGVVASYSKDELSIDDEAYKQMSFKQAGHWRYLSLLNNRDEAVTLTVRGQGTTMDCTWKRSKPDEALEPLQTGVKMEAGEARVYKCVGKASGDYVITFTGDQSGKTVDKNGKQVVFVKNIIVKVWDASAYASIYTDTPLGSVFVSEKYMVAEYPDATKGETAPAETKPVTPAAPAKSSHSGEATVSLADAAKDAPKELGQVDGYDRAMYDICRNYFCTYSETEAAFRSFLQLSLMSLDDKTKDEASLNRLCSHLPEGKQAFQRSAVIQMTNTLTEFGGTKRDFMKIVNDGIGKAGTVATGAGFDGVKLDTQTSGNELRGCGVYVVTSTADLKCASKGSTVASWRNKIALQVSVRKIADCPVNVANAALLTAEEPEQFVGKQRIGLGSVDFSALGSITNPGKLVTDLLSKGLVQFSPYSDDNDANDALTADALRGALFGKDFKKEWVRDGTVVRYNDAPFCLKEAGLRGVELGAVSGTIIGTSLAIHAAEAGATMGVSSLSTGKALIEAGSKIALTCGIGAVTIEGISSSLQKTKFRECNALNDCGYGVMAASFDVAFNSIPMGTVTADVLANRILTDAAFITLGSVGAGVLEGTTGTEVSMPVAYAGGRVARNLVMMPIAPTSRLYNWKMGAMYGMTSTEAAMAATAAAYFGGPARMGTLQQFILSKETANLDKLGLSAETKIDPTNFKPYLYKNLGYDPAKFSALATTGLQSNDEMFNFLNSLTDKERAALADKAAEIKKFAEVEKIDDFTSRLSKVGGVDAEFVNSYRGSLNSLLKQPGNYEQFVERGLLSSTMVGEMGTAFGRAPTFGEFTSLRGKIAAGRITSARGLGSLDEALTLGADTAKKPGVISRAGSFLKKVGMGAIPILAAALFHVEFRPYRAELNDQVISHYVVTTTRGSAFADLPTIYSYCQKGTSDQKCLDAPSAEISQVCAADDAGCVKIAEANNLAGVKGYTLFVTINDDKLKPKRKELLSSLFEPNEPPLNPEGDAAKAFSGFKVEVVNK
ncbi:Uncharacterised protein [Candidatus Norongarragalina meridionalis]|nr:Uncharacterised protein [Candidatus Norongarragalina meridionalis]